MLQDLGDAGSLAPRVLVEADRSKLVLDKRNRVPLDLSLQQPPIQDGKERSLLNQKEGLVCYVRLCSLQHFLDW